MSFLKPYLTLYSCIAVVTLCIFGVSFFVSSEYKPFMQEVLLASIILGTLPFVYHIVVSFCKGKFGVDVIAIMAIVASLALHEYVAAGVILIMLSGGESLEKFAENRARHSLEKLIRRIPTVVSVYKNNQFVNVSVNEIKSRDIVAVKKEEVIPVDGVVLEGISTIDESAITGEPIPKSVTVGSVLISGTINTGDFFTMRATAVYEKSVFSGIIRLVKQAEKEKAYMVTMAEKYSIYFMFFTVVVAVLAYLKDPHLAVAVLVVATPCPLILATPIAFIAGMSRAAKKGIIVKHGGVFELLEKTRIFFFDKTGTLTQGIPHVANIISYDATFSEEDILAHSFSLEQGSSHILAQSIIEYAKEKKSITLPVTHIHEVVGKGIIGTIEGKEYHMGSLTFLDEEGVALPEEKESKEKYGRMCMYIAEEKRVIGVITFSDALRNNAKETIALLKNSQKKSEFILVTGDDEVHAKEVGKKLGFTSVKANFHPEDKLAIVKEYEQSGKCVAMIGDGVNDAPSLALASVGIALGSHGATASTDIADVVIMVDDIGKVADLLLISKSTMRIARESMYAGMGLSVIAMGFAFFGFLPPLHGALLQEGIDVIVILNALRAL